MNLTEIQVELRKVNNTLQYLSNELEELKPKSDAEQKKLYDKIDSLAKSYTIQNNMLINSDIQVKKTYLKILSFVTQHSQSDLEEKLCFLMRISNGIHYSDSSEEIVRLGMNVDQEDLSDIQQFDRSVGFSLIVDALLLISLDGKPKEKDMEFVVSLAQILGFDEEEMVVLSTMATAVLTNNFDLLGGISVITKDQWRGVFNHYIPKEWRERQVICCGVYSDNEESISESISFLSYKYTALKKSGEYVKEGDMIIRTSENLISQAEMFESMFNLKNRTNRKIRESIDGLNKSDIIAPISGVVNYHQCQDATIKVYVLGYFADK